MNLATMTSLRFFFFALIWMKRNLYFLIFMIFFFKKKKNLVFKAYLVPVRHAPGSLICHAPKLLEP